MCPAGAGPVLVVRAKEHDLVESRIDLGIFATAARVNQFAGSSVVSCGLWNAKEVLLPVEFIGIAASDKDRTRMLALGLLSSTTARRGSIVIPFELHHERNASRCGDMQVEESEARPRSVRRSWFKSVPKKKLAPFDRLNLRVSHR